MKKSDFGDIVEVVIILAVLVAGFFYTAYGFSIRVLFRVLIIATTKRTRTSNKLSQIAKTGSIWHQWCKALVLGQPLTTGANTGQPARLERVNINRTIP